MLYVRYMCAYIMYEIYVYEQFVSRPPCVARSVTLQNQTSETRRVFKHMHEQMHENTA